jgi:regulatory protein
MSEATHIRGLKVLDKRTGQRVVIEFTNGETLEVDPEIVVANRLKTGDALSPEAIERLRLEDEALRARRKLVGYLSLRVKSVADARLYLEKAGFGERAISAAVDSALERDLLDDRRFAERYVRTQLKTSTHGPLRLLADLTAHGIDSSLAEEILAPQFDLDWQRETAESRARKRLGKQRFDEDMDRVDVVKKLYDYLQRQGFAHEVALDVADRVVKGK